MNTLRKLLHHCILLLAALAVAGCSDDMEIDQNGIPRGMANLDVQLTFDQETASLSTRAIQGGDEGRLIEDIRDLYMAVYNVDTKVMKLHHVYKDGQALSDPDITNVKYEKTDNRPDYGDGSDKQQDDATGRITYNFKLASGRYNIYAIANVDGSLLEGKTSPEQLKAIDFEWNTGNTALNNQMFGVFTINSINPNADDKNPLTVNPGTAKLYCGVKRLASKVTIAFDGRDLFDNVQIYITDVAIRDIPKRCTLGEGNRAGAKELDEDGKPYHTNDDLLAIKRGRYGFEDGVLGIGQRITVQTLPEDETEILPGRYIHINNSNSSYLGFHDKGGEVVSDSTKAHANDAVALFFYENNQGTGKSKKQSQDGINIDFPNDSIEEVNNQPSGWKDQKPFGTYVEVKGYYRNINSNNNVGHGPIIYRFMLGQDADRDYNAKRNTHYKLTLRFKGNGNDADWHIEYKEKPGIYVTSPQYISYLYNKKMMASIKIIGELKEGTKLKAEIVGNPDDAKAMGLTNATGTYWRPWGDGSEDFPIPVGGHADGNTSIPDPNYDNPSTYAYYNGEIENDGAWNSFLSLRQTNIVTIDQPAEGQAMEDGTISKDDAQTGVHHNELFYTKENKGNREYEIAPGPHEDAKDGSYFVEAIRAEGNSATEQIFHVPLYTRAKVLNTRTGYSGNNPYVAYPRKARVHITAELENGTPIETYLDIIQVRRIVNPKAVWRREGNQTPFHVTLLRLPKDDEHTDFEEFDSDGGWCADVVSGDDGNIITLTSTQKGSGENSSLQEGLTHIEGLSEHPIDFYINFTGKKGHAGIRIRYHNYTCEHDIYCAVGDDPVQLNTNTSIWWETRNVYRFDTQGNPVLTETPMEEGSLFRRGNPAAILAINNIDLREPLESFSVLEKGSTSVTNKSWTDLKPELSRMADWDIPDNDKNGKHIATIQDFFTLLPSTNDDELTFPIKQAYGVLYGDAATEVQHTQEGSYRYMRDGDQRRGMRGCIVYNVNTLKHIFLPIGNAGFGHRKNEGGWQNHDLNGTLRYATRSSYFSRNSSSLIKYQPLFEDLFRRPGAIYWCKENKYKDPDNKTSSAFDINYFSFSFKGYNGNATRSIDGENYNDPDPSIVDAAFVRTVYTTDPTK